MLGPQVYTRLVEREDGDFDHVEYTKTQDEDGNEVTSEKVMGIVAKADKDYPNGRPSNDEVAERNRSFRNEYLQETDWWANSDVTMTEAQRTYRQALRDITAHSNWPNLSHEDWPSKP